MATKGRGHTRTGGRAHPHYPASALSRPIPFACERGIGGGDASRFLHTPSPLLLLSPCLCASPFCAGQRLAPPPPLHNPEAHERCAPPPFRLVTAPTHVYRTARGTPLPLPSPLVLFPAPIYAQRRSGMRGVTSPLCPARVRERGTNRGEFGLPFAGERGGGLAPFPQRAALYVPPLANGEPCG